MHPDHIIERSEEFVQQITPLSYVNDIKVAYTTKNAVERLDNIVIYFYDPPGTKYKDQLETQLLPFGQYTRPDHPPMMDPVRDSLGNPTQGMAFADESTDDPTISWGTRRTTAIAEAVWKLKMEGKKISLGILEPEVEKTFHAHGINFRNPHWSLQNKKEE